MPRALSRLALNRGGPRDLGAILAGLKAATEIAALFGDGETPAHLRTAPACTAGLFPARSARGWRQRSMTSCR
jgi:DNA mismatch repair protein MutS